MYKILLLLILVACGRQIKPSIPDTRQKLIVFGDSLSMGVQTFPWMISKDLNLRIENQAMAGSFLQEDWQIGRIRRAVITKNDIVVFLAGYNNVRSGGLDQNGYDSFATYFTEVIEIFKASGAQIYIGATIGFLPPTPAVVVANSNGSNEASLLFANLIKQIITEANADNIHVVDTNALFTPNETTISADLIHPSAAGHRLLADIFETEINK